MPAERAGGYNSTWNLQPCPAINGVRALYCLMFDLHIKNETPNAEKIQAVYRRYTNPGLMSAAGPAHREAPR